MFDHVYSRYIEEQRVVSRGFFQRPLQVVNQDFNTATISEPLGNVLLQTPNLFNINLDNSNCIVGVVGMWQRFPIRI